MPLRLFAAVLAASALHAQAPSAAEIRTSISRALPVVQRATTEFYKSQDCHSCHHLSLPLLTYAVARERGVSVDEEAARAIASKGLAKIPDITSFDRAVQDNMIIDTVVSDGWALIAANAAADVNERDDDQMTPLHWAVLANHAEAAKALIAAGANVNAVDKHGFTPLHYAVTVDFGNADTVKALVAAGADRSIKTKDGKTAAMQAEKLAYLKDALK
jgi:hypothetical protein